jgi:putative oxidoreductase
MFESPVTEKTNEKQPAWFSLLRFVLGMILFWKGIIFIRDTELLKTLISRTGIGVFTQNSEVLSFIVAYLSLLCGLFIACGLFTKTSSIVQIPILFIAVFFINIRNFENSTFEWILSIVTLILLVFFAIKGSGALSADEFFRTYYKAGTEDGHTQKFFEKL